MREKDVEEGCSDVGVVVQSRTWPWLSRKEMCRYCMRLHLKLARPKVVCASNFPRPQDPPASAAKSRWDADRGHWIRFAPAAAIHAAQFSSSRQGQWEDLGDLKPELAFSPLTNNPGTNADPPPNAWYGAFSPFHILGCSSQSFLLFFRCTSPPATSPSQSMPGCRPTCVSTPIGCQLSI